MSHYGWKGKGGERAAVSIRWTWINNVFLFYRKQDGLKMGSSMLQQASRILGILSEP